MSLISDIANFRQEIATEGRGVWVCYYADWSAPPVIFDGKHELLARRYAMKNDHLCCFVEFGKGWPQ